MVGRAFFLALCSLGAAALGFTTYTRPIEGAGTDPDLRALIVRALHDSEPTLPSASTYLPVEVERPDSLQLAASRPNSDQGPSGQVTDWLRRAALTDSAALRGWLGGWVGATVTTQHDAIHLTLYRLTLHRGCPLLSTLQTTSRRSANWQDRLTRIQSTCPVVR
jgi:hypothetical protein